MSIVINLNEKILSSTIAGVDPKTIRAGQVNFVDVTLMSADFGDPYYRNVAYLLRAKDNQPSQNVVASEPKETVMKDGKLVIPVKANIAVLAELAGEEGNNRKFRFVVHVLADDGSVLNTLVTSEANYIEFTP